MDVVEDENPEVDAIYLKILQAHTDSTSEHLKGADSVTGPNEASFLAPCSYWTRGEKDLFFHGLSVYSRLRPDLIAADIPTKTVLDICYYLNVLENAAAGDPEVYSRTSFEPAVEVSKDWIKWEDEQSALVISHEPTWEDVHRQNDREETLLSECLSLKTPKGERNREERLQCKESIEELESQRMLQWEKEDYMRDLSATHLRVIDNILREAEEPTFVAGYGQDPKDYSPSSQTEEFVTSNFIPDSVIDPALLDISMHRLPEQTSALMARERASEHLPPERSDNGTLRHSFPPTETRLGTDSETEDPSSLTPRSRRRLQKRLYMRRKRAALSGTAASAAALRLKPGRKTNKRLSRALTEALASSRNSSTQPATGRDDSPSHWKEANFPTENDNEQKDYGIDYGGKEEFDHELEDITNAPSHEETSEETGPTNDNVGWGHPNIGGPTLHYKIKTELSDLGLDAPTLVESGLGLFHLANMAKLMTLHSSLQNVPLNIGSQISSTTVELLHAHLVHFLHELIYRTITLREEEEIAKVHTKVWRIREGQIAAASVFQALELMNAERDRKNHFESLVERTAAMQESVGSKSRRKRKGTEQSNAQMNDGVPQEREREDTDVDENEKPGSTSTRNVSLSAYREVYEPMIRLPTYARVQSEASLLRGSSIYAVGDDDTESLMSEHTDEDALLDELSDEEDLDESDEALAKELERASLPQGAQNICRNSASRDEPSGMQDMPSTAEGDSGKAAPSQKRRKAAGTLRFVKPDPHGAVKSSVYVEDSDQ